MDNQERLKKKITNLRKKRTGQWQRQQKEALDKVENDKVKKKINKNVHREGLLYAMKQLGIQDLHIQQKVLHEIQTRQIMNPEDIMNILKPYLPAPAVTDQMVTSALGQEVSTYDEGTRRLTEQEAKTLSTPPVGLSSQSVTESTRPTLTSSRIETD